jgi:hypothetical protein
MALTPTRTTWTTSPYSPLHMNVSRAVEKLIQWSIWSADFGHRVIDHPRRLLCWTRVSLRFYSVFRLTNRREEVISDPKISSAQLYYPNHLKHGLSAPSGPPNRRAEREPVAPGSSALPRRSRGTSSIPQNRAGFSSHRDLPARVALALSLVA